MKTSIVPVDTDCDWNLGPDSRIANKKMWEMRKVDDGLFCLGKFRVPGLAEDNIALWATEDATTFVVHPDGHAAGGGAMFTSARAGDIERLVSCLWHLQNR